MSINRKATDRVRGIATVYNTATSEVSYVEPNSGGIIFDRGRGQSNWDGPWFGNLYGEWTIIPHEDFDAQVKCWGAGGGAHGSTGGAAGGGGFCYADVTFLKDKPYVIWVGESGFYGHHNYDTNGTRIQYRIGITFGGGAGGGHNGGGGGGLSGLFFDCLPTAGGPHGFHGATSTSFKSPGQQSALMIAGGGGGAGHHGTTNHGQGGGGGGVNGAVGHGQAPANQANQGHSWNAGSAGHEGAEMTGGFSGGSSYTGGGGGGWFGGSGGSHSGSHHNGGSGGSGHLLNQNSQTSHPNRWILDRYPSIVSNSYQETAPGAHQNHNPAAAGTTDPDYIQYTGYGAGNSATFTPALSSGNNGRVVVRLK